MSHVLTLDHRSAFRLGCRSALGVPAAVLLAGMIGFGALGHASGIGLGLTTFTSFFMYALPGQVVFVEMVAMGASGVATVIATALTAARFLPMTLTLVPQIPHADRTASLYAKAHLISMTSWAVMMVCWSVGIPGTALGYLSAGHVPTPVTIGLVLINPLFFLLSFAEVRVLASRLAIVFGGISGPLVYQWSPSWSILICGLVGGTLAFWIEGRLRPTKPSPPSRGH